MRRNSEAVTREKAEDFGRLLADSRITPSMLAALTLKPDIVYNSWLILTYVPQLQSNAKPQKS